MFYVEHRIFTFFGSSKPVALSFCLFYVEQMLILNPVVNG